MVSPAHKRELAKKLVGVGHYTKRAVCRHLALHRSTFRYAVIQPSAWMARLSAAVREMSDRHPEMGYKKITCLLKQEGWHVGSRVIQKLRREAGLRVPVKRPRKRRQGPSTGLPTTARYRNHVWAWDFVQDFTLRGGTIKMFTLIDKYTRECICVHVDRRIGAKKVQTIMNAVTAEHGSPEYIRSDNGSEFIEKNLRRWLAEHNIKTIYIDPGSPWQNGYAESFNSRLRDECLNREYFYTLTESRVVIEDWRWKYNNIRPHGSLGYLTPRNFAHPEGSDSSRVPPSLRPSLDSLYHLGFYIPINPPRLTLRVEQFV